MSRFTVLAAACVATGGSLFGYDAGVLSGAILFIREAFGLGPVEVELLVGAAVVGATVGAIASGPIVDRYGRRGVLVLAAAVFATGEITSALAPQVSVLIAARIVVGLGIGVTSYTVPLYISELAPPQSRGMLVSFSQLAVTGGLLVGYVIDFALAGSGAWRLMLSLAVVPVIVLVGALAVLPDSPRWLMWHGRTEAAQSVLRRVLGRQDVSAELHELQATLVQQRGGWADLLSPEVRRPLVVGLGLAMFQQLTGINAIIYYAPTLLQGAGFPSAAGAILATVGIGAVNLLMTIVAMALLDRAGRRPLLLGSLAGVTVMLAVLGADFRFAMAGPEHDLATLSVVALMLYVGAFAMGLGPVFWLLIAEIFPLRVRAVAMSLATAANWATTLVVSSTFLTLVQALGQSTTFWLYALMSLIALVFAFRLVPETRGRTLEEIERQWRSTPGAAKQPGASRAA
jgi:sugar porter (SP) family MFS transporter